MTTKKMVKIPRGLGLVYYLQHRDFILTQLNQGYPVTQIYRDLQANSSNTLMPSYRQLLKLIYTHDKNAARHVSYHRDREIKHVNSHSPANNILGNTPKIENGISLSPKQPKRSDALKPKKFTYNPHYNESKL